MKIQQFLRNVTCAGIGSMAALCASAQQEVGPWYGGVGAGQAKINVDEQRVSDTLFGAGLGSSTVASDERDVAYKLFGGYQFNRYFALEGGWFDLGQVKFNATTQQPSGTFNGQFKVQGVGLDGVGTYPLVGSLSALGRVGVQFSRTTDVFSGTEASTLGETNPSHRGTDYKVGFGLQYAFTPSVLLRGEAERYILNDGVGNRAAADTYMLSVVFALGSR